jgi:hypothetical protein
MCDALGDIESRLHVDRLRARVRELTSRYDVP